MNHSHRIQICSSPFSQFGSIGSNVIFKVSASGFNLSYQWYRQDGLAIPGACKPFLTIGPLRRGDFGFYRVRIQDYFGAHVLSSWVELSNSSSIAHAPPVFKINPLPARGRPGEYAYLFALATGVNVEYQWYDEKGVAIPGATEKSLTFEPILSHHDFGFYRCLAEDQFGRQTLSNWVELIHEDIAMQKIC